METLIAGLALCYLHFLGAGLKAYNIYGQWFAFPTHIVGGMFLFFLTGSIWWVLVLATLWEVFEYFFDTITRLGDTMGWKCRGWDQAFYGIVGCLVGAAIL